MKKTVPRCLPAPPRTRRHGDRAIRAARGIKGTFVCSAFRRNPAKEQRSGEKCWYLFIQESFANNTYLGAFRNNITHPSELLNQFGSNAPAHPRAEGRLEKQRPPGDNNSPQTPGGSGQPAVPWNPPVLFLVQGGAPFVGAG